MFWKPTNANFSPMSGFPIFEEPLRPIAVSLGILYNSMLGGRFLGFITNSRNGVVLDFGGKKVVVTPDDPEAFADAVRDAAKGVCASGDYLDGE